MASDMALNMSIAVIFENVLKVPANRRRLPVFAKICDPSGYITRDGYFVKDDGSVHKSYAATVIGKEGSLCPSISGSSTLKESSRVSNVPTVDMAMLFKPILSSANYSLTGPLITDHLEQYTSCNENDLRNRPARRGYQLIPVDDFQGRAITKVKEEKKNVLAYDMYTENPSTADPEVSIWSQPPPSHGCTFCRTNGERPEVYESHTIKDIMKRVTCPVLKGLTCTECGATGEEAHTITYCPVRLMRTNGKPISTTIALKRTKVKSNGKRRFH